MYVCGRGRLSGSAYQPAMLWRGVTPFPPTCKETCKVKARLLTTRVIYRKDIYNQAWTLAATKEYDALVSVLGPC